MICLNVEHCSQNILSCDTAASRVRICSLAEMMQLIDAILSTMDQTGHAEQDRFRVRLAVEEAVVNANKHGHQGDWSRPITVDYHVNQNGVVVEVEDEGGGFDPAQVPDPLAPENVERTSGRGLLLIRSFMTGICHNERGNRVCLCKTHLATR